MIETILRKRQARFPNEIGLFPDTPMAEEDLALVTMGNDVTVTVISEGDERKRKLMWALAAVVGRSVAGCHDKDDGMELLCVKCRHITNKLDPETGKLEIRRKSTLRIGGETQKRLLNRMIYVTVSDLIPGIVEKSLRAELEKMVGADTPQRPKEAHRRARAKSTPSQGHTTETSPGRPA